MRFFSTEHPKEITWESFAKKVHVGDVICYGGYGKFSRLIKTVTRSPISHVSTVVGLDRLNFSVTVEEAVSDGVGKYELKEDFDTYDGDLWWLPLSLSSRRRFDVENFLSFAEISDGKAYDIGQATNSALDFLEDTGETHNKEDFRALFCSEFVAGALESARVLKSINASEVTPVDLARFKIYRKDYYQLKGSPTIIRGFNTILATGWGA